ncbi:MAG TPA: hypothetical protein VFV34_21895 [Blastocatellia bacterium]|nr:hypothetical protein [Blastocatellia bacterium]
MFCPNCGTEDNSKSQFCRGCGVELQVVRTAMVRPETVTNAAVTAREQIGQAIAVKIAELRNAKDLKKVVEDVLPKVEHFLESPEERRVRYLRGGVTSAAVGLGLMLGSMLVGWWTHIQGIELAAMLAGCAGILVFFIGLAITFIEKWLTAPKKNEGAVRISAQIVRVPGPGGLITGDIEPDKPSGLASVTEGTTRELR